MSECVYETMPVAPATTPDPEKRVFVHRLFTTIAPQYDWFNRLASLGLDQRWRARAIRESGMQPGMDVLDVCTGTGDLALMCAARAHGQGLVAGVDFNATMLRGAPPKQARARQAVHWLQGDAQALPFQAGSFDRVFIGFSTRNLSDLRLGVAEMARVLRPGGRLVILETGRPANPLVRAGHWLFLMTVARMIGWVLTGHLWPFTYLAKSVKRFLRPSEFVDLLAGCGLAPQHRPLSWGLASLYLATKPVGP